MLEFQPIDSDLNSVLGPRTSILKNKTTTKNSHLIVMSIQD
jgi:hypothetical protein